MLIDGGGHSLMVVDVGAHGVRLLYPFVDGGGCSLMVVDAHCAAKGVLGVPGCWWWLRRKMFVDVYLLMFL